MVATLDMFMNVVQTIMGSADVVGYVMVVLIVILFFMIRMPVWAVIALIYPAVDVLVEYGYLPLWIKAIVLIILGAIIGLLLVKAFR